MDKKRGFFGWWILCVLSTYVWLIPKATSLMCYSCNSLYNESCADLNGDKYMVDCDDLQDDVPSLKHLNFTVCRKISYTVHDSKRVVRQCGRWKHPRFDCYYDANVDLNSVVCECKEDGCNGSVRTESNPLHLVIACLLPVWSILLIR